MIVSEVLLRRAVSVDGQSILAFRYKDGWRAKVEGAWLNVRHEQWPSDKTIQIPADLVSTVRTEAGPTIPEPATKKSARQKVA